MLRVALLTAVLLISGCTTIPKGNEPDWFQYQSETVGISIDSLSECGPAVARNFLHWQTGLDVPREQARAMYRSPGWWWLYHIRSFINSNGGKVRLANWSVEPLRMLTPGEMIIAHINSTHYVAVMYLDKTHVIIHDTNAGIARKTHAQFMRTVSQNHYLIGARP